MLDKNLIIEKTGGGLDIYRSILGGDLKPANKDRMENIKNPFYSDKNAGLSIYKKNGVWYFKDYGDPDYYGDAFQFASYYYDMDLKTEFGKLLQRIVADTGIDLAEVSNGDNDCWVPNDQLSLLTTDGYVLTPMGEDGGYKQAHRYFFSMVSLRRFCL